MARPRAAACADRGEGLRRSSRACRSTRSTSPSSTAGSTRPCSRTSAAPPTRSATPARTAGRPASRATCRSSSVAMRCRSSSTGDELGEDELTRLFERAARSARVSSPPPTALRREVCGDEVTYVVTRNIQYTNVCYFRCGFCAFSKGKLAENLRGPAYLVPNEEIVRRVEEAWERGATEVCLQGGIHPAFTGDYYADVVRVIQDAVPGDARPRVLRARGLAGRRDARARAPGVPRAPARPRSRLAAGHRRRDPRRRGARRHLPRQGDHRPVARGARRGAPGRPALERDDDVRPRRGGRAAGRVT